MDRSTVFYTKSLNRRFLEEMYVFSNSCSSLYSTTENDTEILYITDRCFRTIYQYYMTVMYGSCFDINDGNNQFSFTNLIIILYDQNICELETLLYFIEHWRGRISLNFWFYYHILDKFCSSWQHFLLNITENLIKTKK